ncbi:UDP-4-amino-4,6-dideoxy-N-acetyl-beta-L-altrosamine transaminase [Psychrobacter sp. P2G3]|uniref:UDP-4-amino-4, 6-dideoxy-N-acetyl-beta-L-altrosamine transaminase n=1 Tax=Psychrobacter sp. P2G3 TaxID=1699622 RepID=UPI00078DCD71|nr:UDP-4-amino-4,6-dideoxy-N-acetyl-beta-L-altrosamine transaminase [Psychrobacter sp. P2G3]AMN48590.1 spore coat protein [Psychrobacter sp. P2G3]
MNFIPYGRQNITKEDINAVVEVLESDFLTQGPKVPEFENSIKEQCNVEYALAMNSATSALHVACLALDVGKDDIVWTTPITFVASANCALYCGAIVDFVDINPKTYNLCAQALREKLQIAKAEGELPKVVIPVHLCGQPCDMEGIYELSKEYGFSIIEDASHAIGGKYKDEPIGNCQYSDITIFSFHPVKIITTAEGGVATTNSKYLAQKMDLLRSHGITRDSELMTNEPDGSWYYQQVMLGFNYRMTEMQAALGVSQIKRLSTITDKRHQLAKNYDSLLAELPIITPYQHSDGYSGLHLYVIRLKTNQIQKSHKEVFDELRAANIGVNLHYIPVHLQPYYQQKLGFKMGDFPEAELYYSQAISLPMYPDLTEEQQAYIAQTLRSILNHG